MVRLLSKCSVLFALVRNGVAISIHDNQQIQSVDSLDLGTQTWTRDEIRASMTTEKAIALLTRDNVTKNNPKLVQIMDQIRNNATMTDAEKKKEYDAENTARLMLNGMMEESELKKELEIVRCNFFNIRQYAILRDLEQDIAYVNAESSAARSEILRATEVIQITEEIKLPAIKRQIEEHNEKCDMDRADLTQQLEIVNSDIIVMKRILSLLCAKEEGQGLQFLQTSHRSGAGNIVQCGGCGTRRPMSWIKHDAAAWKPLLATLRSKVAKHLLQEGLAHEVDDLFKSGNAHEVVLTQTEIHGEAKALPGVEMDGLGDHYVAPDTGACDEELLGYNGSNYRGCQSKTQTGKTCQVWDEQYPHMHFEYSESMPTSGLGMHNYCRNPMATKGSIWCYTTDPEVPWEFCSPKASLMKPTGITKIECPPLSKCVITNPSCDKLRDRFLVILAGMIDTRNSLSEEMNNKNAECERVLTIYRHTESALEAQLKEEQTTLAVSQSFYSENMQQSVLYNRQHKELHDEYKQTMAECCENQNKFEGEYCSLERIRGEVYRMAGKVATMVDCKLTSWNDEPCSKSCAGGHQARYRTIMTPSENGTRCPPLRMTQECNREGCPVNCEVDEWSEWSECTALCDGGVSTRTRSKTVEPENDGEPCPEQSETKVCNGGACNIACVLGDWSEWGLCSKACDGGWSTRTKPITVPSVGQGECADAEDPTRMQFQKCNRYDCSQILPPDSNRTLVTCTAMIDLVIMLDGSGSLGDYGWSIFKGLAKELVGAIQGNESGVNLAFMLFSGPDNAADLENCTSGTPDSKPDMDKQCGIKWIHRFTTNIDDVAEAVGDMEYPGKTTLTSTALTIAQSELVNGRQEAMSTVVVITDGKPMSPIKTGEASAFLKEQARLIWIPVGRGAGQSLDDMKIWASKPWEDNVLPIGTLAELNTPRTKNNVLSTICPTVV